MATPKSRNTGLTTDCIFFPRDETDNMADRFRMTYQQQESVLQVLVGLNAPILGAFVVKGSCGVEERNVSISPCA